MSRQEDFAAVKTFCLRRQNKANIQDLNGGFRSKLRGK